MLAPITAEGLWGGDRLAASHPEIRIVRYLLRTFERMPFRPPPPDFLEEERSQVQPLLLQLLETFRPDLVIVGRETFARYVPEITKPRGIPTVLLLRGSPTGHILSGQFPMDETERLLAEFRKVDRIIAVAQYLADGLQSMGFENASHIPNAIDTTQFVRRPRNHQLLCDLGINPAATIVLVPANLHPRKRPEDVILSAERALRTNPNLVYLLAGTGVLQERIQQLCEERKLSDRIRVLGWVTYERMPELMNSADVVLMASESEGFSRAYLEAMACERLLLASDIPPARDLIRDGQNGLLFRMGDIEHMTARTLEAAADPGWREAVGRRARISMEHLSIDSIAPIYLEEFASLLRDRRTAP